MKGSLDVEFILSSFLFIGTVVFITLNIIRTLPLLEERSLSENLQSSSFQISELLMSGGYPANWHSLPIGSVGRVGLASSDYVLDPAKVTALDAACSTPAGYAALRDKFMGLDFIVTVNGTSELLRCEPQVLSLVRPKFVTTRHAVYAGEPVDLSVVVLG